MDSCKVQNTPPYSPKNTVISYVLSYSGNLDALAFCKRGVAILRNKSSLYTKNTMYSASEFKKLKAASKRLKIYVLIWAIAVFFVFAQHFINPSELGNTNALRLFSLLFFLMSIEGIYFKYYWSLKLGHNHSFFIQPKLDEVVVWQGRTAIIFGVLYALLAVVLLVLSF